MLQMVKGAAVVAALCFAPLTQAATVSQSQMSTHTDSAQSSPFGYARQMEKMMRPINDLLPQGSRDEVQVLQQ